MRGQGGPKVYKAVGTQVYTVYTYIATQFYLRTQVYTDRDGSLTRDACGQYELKVASASPRSLGHIPLDEGDNLDSAFPLTKGTV
jgi:hypothetical protein